MPPLSLRRESSAQQSGFVWQFESGEGWVSFGVEDQRQLEQAFANGNLNPLIQGRQFDLQTMTQTNVKSKRERNLRRMPSSSSPRVPSMRDTLGEAVESSVSVVRMHNGSDWMTGRLDLYPAKLVFTPEQSLVRSNATPTRVLVSAARATTSCQLRFTSDRG